MKKLFCVFTAAATLAAALVTAPAHTFAHAEPLTDHCKAAYLCDAEGRFTMYKKEETKRLPIASMCKIMTLLLSFEAVDRGELSYEEEITVSENAAGMGGSQVFLGARLKYPVRELMKTVAVCSANDSCVALAERIAGSEEEFIERMNTRARELGAENTLFANCTGLPRDPQYSCAKDVALMLRELIKHEDYFAFSRVWLEDFAHPDGRTTSITNTNKLVRFYDGCDGGKTGFTNEAGFCLAATAERADLRVIAVVIGGETSKTRFADVSNLFDHAFSCYESCTVLRAGEAIEEKAEVTGGTRSEVAIAAKQDLKYLRKRGEKGEYRIEIALSSLKAPIEIGQTAGRAILYEKDVEIASAELSASEAVGRMRWWDAFRRTAQAWQ